MARESANEAAAGELRPWRRRGCVRRLTATSLFGLLILVLTVQGFGRLASRVLDRRVARLSADLDVMRARLESPRPGPGGAPRSEDAMVSYTEFSVLVTDRGAGLLPLNSNGFETLFDELARRRWTKGVDLSPLSAEHQRLFERAKPALLVLRRALRRRRCSWPFRLEEGSFAEFPDMTWISYASRLLLGSACGEGGEGLLEAGVSSLEFASDLAKYPGVLGSLLASRARETGLAALARALEGELTNEQCRGALERLEETAIDASLGIECERLSNGATFAAICDRPLAEVGMRGLGGDLGLLERGLFVRVLAWQRYDDFMARWQQALEGPRSLRVARLAELTTEGREAWLSLLKLLLPTNLTSLTEELCRGDDEVVLVKIGFAARLHVLTGGGAPSTGVELASLAGLDPDRVEGVELEVSPRALTLSAPAWTPLVVRVARP